MHAPSLQQKRKFVECETLWLHKHTVGARFRTSLFNSSFLNLGLDTPHPKDYFDVFPCRKVFEPNNGKGFPKKNIPLFLPISAEKWLRTTSLHFLSFQLLIHALTLRNGSVCFSKAVSFSEVNCCSWLESENFPRYHFFLFQEITRQV
eukprot:TRINITY_DN2964_c6_g1_i1.p1 TRINITY_DN2964_c6_g1~~TRINITY_DN2964_c6_g1_i1.p1  ORF type:complete len:148 (+),score=12.82 TRINITY_DN2964_c6_g1_i1:1032-1475(+)